MSLFGMKTKRVGELVSKHSIIDAERSVYENGGNIPSGLNSYQNYIEASSRLDTCLRTASSIASSARFQYGKLDKDRRFREFNFKQADGLYMNDYQTESDFLFELFGTLLTYDKILIIPEESKYIHRKGLIDWVIVPDSQFTANLGTNSTIESFTFKSSTGLEKTYKYEDVIYITRNLTANNLIYAVPRLKSLIASIETVIDIHKYVKSYTKSGGKSSMVIASDSLLSEPQQLEVKRQLQSFLNSNEAKALYLNSEKFNLNKVSDNMSTSGVLDFLTEISREITKAFNMPEYLLGVYSSSTQQGAVTTSSRLWFNIVIRPLFTTLSSAFTRFFRDSFGIKNAVVKFNFDDIYILEDDDNSKLEYISEGLKIGVLSLDESREIIGLEPIGTESSKAHYLQAHLLSSNPISFENFDEDIQRAREWELSKSDVTPQYEGGENNEENMNGVF